MVRCEGMAFLGRYQKGDFKASKGKVLFPFIVAVISFVFFSVQFELSPFGGQLFRASPSIASAASEGWYEDFEGTVSGGYHNRSGCGRQEYTSEFAYRGQRSHKSEITVAPCPDNPLRYYPTFDGNFKLPVLVTYWFYMDAESWDVAAGDRFSPLTVKETSGVPDARIFTTHVLSSGIMDCGHCSMTFQSKSVKVPLHQWNLQSAYIENKVNPNSGVLETYVSLYVDDQLVVEGIVDNTFAEGYVKHWHMGLYADREGNSGTLTMYNDEMRVRSVSGKNEAESLIQTGLGGGNTCSSSPDVTQDGRIDVLDLQTLANEILAGSSSNCFDLNSDQAVDIEDLHTLRDRLLSNP
jgi:hypothetical protein